MSHFFNKTISAVKRMTYTSNKSTLTTATGLTAPCYLEPLAKEMAAQSGLQWGTSFSVFIDTGVSIGISDLITIDSVDYLVKGKADYDQLASHIELLVVKNE